MHLYKCSCPDFTQRHYICKHIHKIHSSKNCEDDDDDPMQLFDTPNTPAVHNPNSNDLELDRRFEDIISKLIEQHSNENIRKLRLKSTVEILENLYRVNEGAKLIDEPIPELIPKTKIHNNENFDPQPSFRKAKKRKRKTKENYKKIYENMKKDRQ